MSDTQITVTSQRNNRRRLVEALESGQYKKGIACLRTNDEYCCLGVALDLIDAQGWDSIDHRNKYTHKLGSSMTEHPTFCFSSDKLYYMDNEIAEKYYGFSCDNQRDLSVLNDVVHKTFGPIAQRIRQLFPDDWSTDTDVA